MKQIQLVISNPCHQNFDMMVPAVNGRFCNACEKQVVDFTSMNDGQVLNYLNNAVGQNVCGRLRADQLNRSMQQPAIPKRRWMYNYIVFLMTFFFRPADTIAQTSVQPIMQQPVNLLQGDTVVLQGQIAPARRHVISGQLKDTNGNPASLIIFTINNKGQQYTTDNNGFFKVDVDDKDISITIRANNYETKIVRLKQAKFFTVILKAKKTPPVIMGKMIATPVRH